MAKVVPVIEAGDLDDHNLMLRLVLMAIQQAEMESPRHDLDNVDRDIARIKRQLALLTNRAPWWRRFRG